AGLDGRSALGSLVDGGAQLVTGSLPLVAGGPALGIAVVAFSIATVGSVELSRRTGLLWPLGPPLLLYGAVLLVTGGGPPGPRDGALLVAAASALCLLLRHSRAWWQAAPADTGHRVLGSRRAPRRAGAGPTLAGLVLVGVAGLVAWASTGATALPGSRARQPYDLRAALSPPPVTVTGVSLLSRFASIHDGPARPAFEATVQGAPPGRLYWRLATYDQFRGDGWTSSALYRLAGRTLPPATALQVQSVPVSVTVRLTRPARYLPVVGTPVSVSVQGLGVSEPDNLLVVPAGKPLPPGYSFRSVLADPSKEQLLSAEVPGGRFDPASAPLSPTVTSLAANLAAHARPDPFSRLTAIATYLRGPTFGLQPPGRSPIGNGTYQVDQLLSVTRSGSPEQYAAAFALLARAMGFPSRLVIGYSGEPTAASGAVSYTTRDLSVWPEVELAGIGWVPFPANPAVGQGGSSSPAPAPGALGEALHEQQAVNAAPPPPAPTHPEAALPTSTAAGPRAGGPGWVTVLLMVAVAVAGAAGLAVGAVLAAKARRRRRQRRSGDGLERMRGSWQFVVDRVEETGIGVPPVLTREETADRIGDALGSSCRAPVAVLAPLVDAAVYDRRHPPAAGQVDAAWQQAEALDAELRRALSPARRLRAAVSVAPFRRRIRKPFR
ncbi:MAG: transglutaminase family protein, partial [Acidimicrobiales bacterium]|nr:transglutaminase family protein [Acidimicrobiales bacterium]